MGQFGEAEQQKTFDKPYLERYTAIATQLNILEVQVCSFTMVKIHARLSILVLQGIFCWVVSQQRAVYFSCVALLGCALFICSPFSVQEEMVCIYLS